MITAKGNLVAVPQLCEELPALTPRLIRYWLQRDIDGFRSRCTVKIRRRVFFDLAEVAVWVEEHRPILTG